MDIAEKIAQLTEKDNVIACAAAKELSDLAEKESLLYVYFDRFLDMTDSNNSYIRTRGLSLIVRNARWDSENKIDKVIDKLLSHIADEKPITSRKFIELLPILAKYKPKLKQKIVDALISADISKYKDSMLPLVKSDIENALNSIGIQA